MKGAEADTILNGEFFILNWQDTTRIDRVYWLVKFVGLVEPRKRAHSPRLAAGRVQLVGKAYWRWRSGQRKPTPEWLVFFSARKAGKAGIVCCGL